MRIFYMRVFKVFYYCSKEIAFFKRSGGFESSGLVISGVTRVIPSTLEQVCRAK